MMILTPRQWWSVPLLALLLASASRGAASPPNGDAECQSRLSAAITEAVSVRLGVPKERVKITLHAVRLPPECARAQRVTVRLPEAGDVLGAVTLRATFDSTGGTPVTLPVPIRVDLLSDVLVTTRRLNRHEIIGRNDLMFRRQSITDVAPWVMSDPDSVIGCWADRTINAGQIVDRRWVKPVPLVRRGERVLVAYDTGAVRVSTAAVAVEDGYQGQKIRVKPVAGQKLLTVSVIGEKTVRPVP